MIERCIVCHCKFVDRDHVERFLQLCVNCLQKVELRVTHQDPSPPIANTTDVMAALEQAFRKRFEAA